MAVKLANESSLNITDVWYTTLLSILERVNKRYGNQTYSIERVDD